MRRAETARLRHLAEQAEQQAHIWAQSEHYRSDACEDHSMVITMTNSADILIAQI